MTHHSRYFYGVEITPHELHEGYISYATLAKTFDAVLCNDITKLFYSTLNGEYIEPELYSGETEWEDSDGEMIEHDIYQYYIIDGNGVDILSEWTDEIIYYIEPLDIYIWGVTHFGTSWDDVNTSIKIERWEV